MGDRWYITKEIPILGVLAGIAMACIACYFLYIIVFKGMIPNIKKKWPSLSSRDRFRLIAKNALVLIGIIAGLALFVWILRNFKVDFSH